MHTCQKNIYFEPPIIIFINLEQTVSIDIIGSLSVVPIIHISWG